MRNFKIAGIIASSILFSISTVYAMEIEHKIEPETECIALNIYHEARGEPELGMEAVAWVTVNRVEDERYPDNICNVVYQKSQFSWTTKKDNTPYEVDSWEKAIEIAVYVLDENNSHDPTLGALYFHNKSKRPKWASRFVKTAKIGNHIFYR